MRLSPHARCGNPMSVSFFCTFLFLLICTFSNAQTLDFVTVDSDCESNGSIMVTCTGCSPTVEFQISAGPICSSGICPVNDSPVGMFSSIPSGTYTIQAISGGGIEVTADVTVGGNYVEPLPIGTFDFPCPGQMDANIDISISAGTGTAPYEYRAFAGVVGDFPDAIGPTEMDLPFGASSTITGFGTGVHSFQVKDACGVIRTGELVISDTPPIGTFPSIFCSDQDNCVTSMAMSRFTGEIDINDSRLTNHFPIYVYIYAQDGTERAVDTINSSSDPVPRIEMTEDCGQRYGWRFETACGLDFTSPYTSIYYCVSPSLSDNEFCDVTTNTNRFNIFYSGTNGVCLNNLESTVYICGEENGGTPIFEGSIYDWDPPLSTSGTSYYIETVNTCNDSTAVLDCYTPIRNPLNWRHHYNCESDLASFSVFEQNVIIVDAPAGYGNPLPDTLDTPGFWFNVIDVPPGDYSLSVDEGCGNDTFDITASAVDYSIELDSTLITCQTTTFYVSYETILPPGIINQGFPNISLGYENQSGFWVNIQNQSGFGTGTRTFTLDNNQCEENLEIRVFNNEFGNLELPGCSIDLSGQCYAVPDGVDLLGIPCLDGIQSCPDGSQPYNVIASAPEMDGLGPFTWDIYEAGTTNRFVPQIITPDTVIVLEEICAADLTLDIFITDACGNQIMSEIGFGILIFDLQLDTMGQVCNGASYDLNTSIKPLVRGGTWTATDGGPAPDANGIVTPATTDEGCFNYMYMLSSDNIPGICTDLQVPFELCVEAGVSNIMCPDTLIVECDGMGNLIELEAWLEMAMIDEGCVDADSVDITSELVISIQGNGYVSTDTYEFTADDGNGNTATCRSQFIIEDTSAPTVVGTDGTAPDEVSCEDNFDVALSAWINSIVVTDDCGEPTTSTELVSVEESCDGTNTIVTYSYSVTATDEAGNISEPLVQTFMVIDDTAPTITAPEDLEIECGGENVALISNWLMDYVVTEACQEVTVTNNWDGMVPDLCDATTIPVTWTVSDACGASATAISNIIVTADTEGPEFQNCPADMVVNVDADLCTANVIYSTPVATDCNGVASVALTSGPASGTPFDLGPNTILFTATDECGNTSTCSFIITVEDTGIPTINCPGNLTVCSDDGICTWASTDELIPSSMENCPDMEITHTIVSEDGSIDATDAVGPVAPATAFPLGTSTITYTITDGAGLTSSCSFTVIVEDCEAPVITCPMNMVVECDGAGNTSDLESFLMGAEVSDNCETTIEATAIAFNTVASCGMASTTTYEFTAIDDAGNVSKCYADFTIEDNVEPTIATAAVDVVAECDGLGNAAGYLAWIASNGGILDSEVTEDCGSFEWRNNLSDVVFTENAVCTGEVGYWEVDFWVEDDCGNISEPITLRYSIEDTSLPSITAPTNIVLQCGDATNDGTLANWLNQAIVSDDCSAPTVTNDFVAGPTTCGESTTVIWTVTDACGNTATSSAMVEMIDDQKPIVMVPPTPLFLDCSADNTTVIEDWLLAGGDAVVVDNCSEDFEITSELIYENVECEGNQFSGYTITFTDVCGNSTSVIGNISISDTLAPSLTGLAFDLNVVCDGSGNVSDLTAWLGMNGGAIAEDECSEVTWSQTLISSINDCGDTGSDTYVFTATDACGHSVSDTASFTITASPIMLTGGADYSTECQATGTGNDIELISWLNNNAGIVAANDCGSVVWTNDFDNANWVDGCAEGQNIDVTFTATDACGNQESLTFNFSTSDNTVPEFLNCPNENYIFETPLGTCEVVANFSLPIADDNCGEPLVEQTDATGLTSGSFFPIGITVLEFTATDECGNSSTCEVTIEVIDLSNSIEVSCPDSISIGNDMGECGATVEDIALNIGGNICDIQESITYEILDSLGQVIDSGDNDASGTFFPLGANTVVYTFTDEFGNPDECSFLVEVADLEAPTCASPGDLPYAQSDELLSISELDCGVEFEWNHPIFSDNCMGGTIDVTYEYTDTLNGINEVETAVVLSLNGSIDLDGDLVSRVFGVGETVVTYVLEDSAGNLNLCSFTVTVEANEAPEFAAGCEDIIVNLDAGECSARIFPPIDLTNTCGIDTVLYSSDGEPVDLDNLPIGITILDIEAIDVYGNVGTCTITVTVVEFDNPISSLTCNNEINVSLDAACQAIVTQDMVLEGGPYGCYDDYCMEITDPDGNIVDNLFDINDVNTEFTVSIIDCDGTGNMCWGTINIENKLIPELICPADTLLMCNQDPSAVYPNGHPQAGELIYGMAFIETCEIDAAITYSDEFIDYGECSEPRAELIRTWKITDADDNEVTCEQKFEFAPFDPMMVVYPEDYTLDNSLECSDVEADPSLTEPANTGYPTFGGEPIIGNNFCDIHLGYWDELLVDVNCPSAYLIYRHWVIDNECIPIQDGINPLEYIQRIKVKDSKAPIISELEDVTVNVDPWSCEGSYELPAIMNTDDCSSFEVEWHATYGQIVGNEVTNLVLGETVINVKVADACGNESFGSFTITSIDFNPPTIISETQHTVSLSSDGIAKVYAEDLDDGSYDGCTDIGFAVIRMDEGGSCQAQDYFAPPGDDNAQLNEVVHFCCADVGDEPVMVMLQVCDDADQDGIFNSEGDNCNQVMIEVFVQEKLAPQIICPGPASISCTDIAGLDLTNTDLLDELFGTATAAGTCGVEVIQTALGDEFCGDGVIIRNFTATNSVGTTSCQQLISVSAGPSETLTCDRLSFEDLSSSIYNWCAVNDNDNDNDDDLPAIEIDCNDGLEIPALSIDINGLCTQVGEQYSIDTFNFAGGACKKYVIHYEVINQCTFDENYVDPVTGELDPYQSSNGYFEFYLEVDAFDTEDPEPVCETLTFVSQSCTGFDGSFGISGTDNCTEVEFLSYQWRIDVNGDDTIDFPATGWFTTSEVSPDQLGLDEFPIGQHIVYWIISDGCGNNGTCGQTINVLAEDKEPTPYCVDGLSIAVMPANGTVDLWANDFDAGSFDNCGDELTLTMVPEMDVEGLNYLEAYGQSFTHPNVTQQPNGDYGFSFDCSYIPNGVTAIIEVRIYVTDADGNWDYCTASLRIDDNFGACIDNGDMLVYEASGSLKTELEAEINNVEVEVNATFPEFPMMEVVDGYYSFDLLELIDYDITPTKNDDYLDGVTSLDIIKIQKHILGLEVLESPYLKIAADVNSDCKINGIDIIQLRKLLLGKYVDDELPNNDAWRFVEADYQFAGTEIPCDYSEIAELYDLSSDEVNDFIGVKIGDLNGSAENNLQDEIDTRSVDPIELHLVENLATDANYSYISFKLQERTELYGLQMNLDFIESEFIDIEAGILDIQSSNIGFSEDNRTLFISYDEVKGVQANEGVVLFTIKVKKTDAATFKNVIQLNKLSFNDEAYVESTLETKAIELVYPDNQVVTEEVKLFQNEPNPFAEQTSIMFSIPQDGNVKLTVYDVNGNVHYSKEDSFSKGINQIKLTRNDISVSGLLYYKIEMGDEIATRKMIVIQD